MPTSENIALYKRWRNHYSDLAKNERKDRLGALKLSAALQLSEITNMLNKEYDSALQGLHDNLKDQIAAINKLINPLNARHGGTYQKKKTTKRRRRRRRRQTGKYKKSRSSRTRCRRR